MSVIVSVSVSVSECLSQRRLSLIDKKCHFKTVEFKSCRSYFDRKRFLKQLKKRRHVFLNDNYINREVYKFITSIEKYINSAFD